MLRELDWSGTKRKDRREKVFLQLSFFLPIVFPLLTYLLVSPQRVGLNGFRLIYLVVVSSLVIGGIPYVFFLVGIFFWMRGKGADEIRRMTWNAPVLCVPALIGCALLLIPVQIAMTGQIGVEAGGVALFSVFILIFGYAYVLVVNAAFFLFTALMRRLDPSEDDIPSTNLW